MKREMSLLEIFQAMIKRASTLLSITIVFAVLGAGVSLVLNKEVYSSTTSLIVGHESRQETGEFNKINGEPIYEEVIEYGESSISDQAKRFYSETLTRRDVLEKVIEQQSLDMEIEEFRENIKMEVPENSSTLLITVNSANLENVDTIADELANTFKEEVYEITEVEKIQTINAASEPAIVNTVSLVKNTVLAIVAGLALGGVLVIVLEYLDDSIQSAKEIEENFDLDVLGEVRTEKTLEEDLKKIRTAIAYSGHLKEKKVLTVAALDDTYKNISSGLSNALVAADQAVLFIDGDLRTPTIQQELGLANETGLSEVLTGDAELANSLQAYPQSRKSKVLTTGQLTAHPSEQLTSQQMKELLAGARESYDYVIVNGHPIKEVTDTVALSTATDGIILVVKENETKTKDLAEVQKLFSDLEVDILGIVLNKA